MRSEFEYEGRHISYLQAPAAGAPGTVLLLHAFPLDSGMWAPQLGAVPAGWRFLAPDCRGFGRSAPDEPAAWTEPSAASVLSIDDYARDALALLDHAGAASAVLVGLSMGGYVAFAMWRLAPHRVRGLVLADTRPDPDTAAGRANRQRQLDTLAREGVAPVAEGMLPKLLGPTTASARRAVVERVRQLAAAQGRDGVGAAILRLMHRPDATPLLPTIDRPVLVIAGEEDELTGPDIARQMHGQMPTAELALIGRAGHLSNLEQPDEFNGALDRFLAQRFLRP